MSSAVQKAQRLYWQRQGQIRQIEITVTRMAREFNKDYMCRDIQNLCEELRYLNLKRYENAKEQARVASFKYIKGSL